MLKRAFVVAALVACGGKTPPPEPPDFGGRQPEPPKPDDIAKPDVAKPAGEADLVMWPAVKKAKLPNGLTYYVLQNKKPEKRAMLWLAVNAGSIQEDDDQRG